MTPDPAPTNSHFGQAPDNSVVLRVTLSHGGTTAHLLTYGARLQDLRRDGVGHPLVLGATSMAAYLGPMAYYGAIVGPVANRIANAGFDLGDTHHALDANENGITTLHGGTSGFSAQNWRLGHCTGASVTFELDHPHGRGGFPGNILVQATYTLDPDGALTLDITGQSDRDTYFSPAFHGYWNLSGQATIHDHRLHIAARSYLAIDGRGIPTGAPIPVAGTPFDFTAPAPVTGGVDHNFCLDPAGDDPVCTLSTDALVLHIQTDQPGLQVYDAGRNDTALHAGLAGVPYGPVSGIALEPQFWPDTPNQPGYPSNLLRAGDTYRQRSRFTISRKH